MSWKGRRYAEPIDLFLPFRENDIDDTFTFVMDVLFILYKEESEKAKEGMPPIFRYSEKQIGIDYRLFLEIIGEYMGNKIKLSQDYGLDEPSPNNRWARLFLNGFYAKTMNLGFSGFYAAFDPFKTKNTKLIISHYASYEMNVVLEYKCYYVEMRTITMLADRLKEFSQEKYNRLALFLQANSPKMISGKGKTPSDAWKTLTEAGIRRRLYR
jgi:hypothetical protein